jgi:EAL domain-containing protein (putative c-di-GMP-specific phosphodiesterase class I)/AmiR/NasT family two-component response regulator
MTDLFLGVRDAHILVVDDESANVILLVKTLEKAGYTNVVATQDSSQAMALFAEHQPDLVLLDLHMPPPDGFDLLDQIRRGTPRTEYLPVLVLTADVTEVVKARALDMGANDYLSKPFSLSEVLLRIRNLLQTRRLYSLLQRRTATIEARLEDAQRPHRDAEQRRKAATLRIREVLDQHLVTMVFQPIVDLGTGSIAGAEALARFPGNGRTPDVWFSEAAQVGLGTDLELDAVQAAVAQLADMPAHAFISVNVSPEVLTSPGFAEAVAPVPPDRLVVELTEHDAISDYARIDDALRDLRADGARLAVDDTGAGYASLRHILRLQPDIIKLDRAIITGLDSDPARRALVAALVHFAQEMRADIVAEGIETEGELAALRDLEVHFGQGYLLARPAPLPLGADPVPLES